MRTKQVVLSIVGMLLLGLLVAPASANKIKDKDIVPGGVKDAGLFSGEARVGKYRTFCTHEGDSDVSGPGLGLPGQARKNAYYEFTTLVTSLFKPTGSLFLAPAATLRICGRMTATHSAMNGGTGAACGASKGWDGKGTIDWRDDLYPGKDTIWLKNLVWKTDLHSGTLVITGDANQAQDEDGSKEKIKADFIEATVDAQGMAPCSTKVDGRRKGEKSGGATHLFMVGTFVIANKITGMEGDQNIGPECKSGAAHGCWNDPKETGKSG